MENDKIAVNRIYNMDCLHGLRTIPDKSVDCVWTDPPYNISYVYDEYVDFREDYFEWCESWIRECFRVLKKDGSIFIKMWFANCHKICTILDDCGFVMRNVIVWKRHSQAGYKNRFLGGYEVIIFYSKSDDNKFYPDRILKKSNFTHRWDGQKEYKGRLHDIWTDIKPVTCGSLKHPEGVYESGTGKKCHPAQHPVELVRRCIISATDENDVVLDPFMGSGTTAVACKRFNRNFLGFEISSDYCDLIKKRLEQSNIMDFFDGKGDQFDGDINEF